MKVVRIDNNTAVEILPVTSLAEAKQYYHPSIIDQCAEVPDEVQHGWVYADGAWSEPTPPEPITPPPSDGERITSLEVENKLLKAQNQSLAERGEFIEDVIAEMAMDFYA